MDSPLLKISNIRSEKTSVTPTFQSLRNQSSKQIKISFFFKSKRGRFSYHHSVDGPVYKNYSKRINPKPFVRNRSNVRSSSLKMLERRFGGDFVNFKRSNSDFLPRNQNTSNFLPTSFTSVLNDRQRPCTNANSRGNNINLSKTNLPGAYVENHQYLSAYVPTKASSSISLYSTPKKTTPRVFVHLTSIYGRPLLAPSFYFNLPIRRNLLSYSCKCCQTKSNFFPSQSLPLNSPPHEAIGTLDGPMIQSSEKTLFYYKHEFCKLSNNTLNY